jgi:hypothetical protein
MAKAKYAGAEVATSAQKPKKGYDRWEIRDAMRTMLRAGEIIKDKKLLTAVKKEAMSHAKELQETAARAGQLAKMGLISPKAMAKMGTR